MSVQDDNRIIEGAFRRVEEASADERSGPHGWVQWKGTGVCMDVHCSCGEHSHIDAEFAYRVRCPCCGAVYHVSGNVRLVPATEEEAAWKPDSIIDGDASLTVIEAPSLEIE